MITIIVLIILAGVSIAILTGDNGIIKNAKEAQKAQIEGEVKDKVNLAILSAKMLAEKESTQNSSGFTVESDLKDNISDLTKSAIYNELNSELNSETTNEYTIYVSNDGKTVTIYYTSAKYKSAVNDDKAGITTAVTVNGNSCAVGTPTYNTKDNEFNASTAGRTANAGGGSSPTNPTGPVDPVGPVYVSSITIAPTEGNSTTVSPNGTTILQANILPANADDSTVTWSSSNTSIATVTPNANGTVTVTGVAVGKATITATANDQKETANEVSGSLEIEVWNGTLIHNRTELAAIRGGGNYRLANDIDLAPTLDSDNDGTPDGNWIPVNTNSRYNPLILDGQGHKISNVTMVISNSCRGMFGDYFSGTIKNICFENVNVTATGQNSDIGLICGTYGNGGVRLEKIRNKKWLYISDITTLDHLLVG